MLSLLLGSLIFGAGCATPAKVERFTSYGYFNFTNSVGVVNSVFWRNHHDATTNDIGFVLVLPETAEASDGGQSRGYALYHYCDLKLKHNDRRWKIEAYKDFKAGFQQLHIMDLTARTVSRVDLERSRFWQVSEDGTLTPLDRLDETISRSIVRGSRNPNEKIRELQAKR
jgi:hypothetical protein